MADHFGEDLMRNSTPRRQVRPTVPPNSRRLMPTTTAQTVDRVLHAELHGAAASFVGRPWMQGRLQGDFVLEDRGSGAVLATVLLLERPAPVVSAARAAGNGL
jgi:hypothetical protein